MSMGKLWTFEGGEGSGKSTQVAYLAEQLRQAGYPVLTTRQPGGTVHGQRIRELILTPFADDTLSQRAELFLYLADRAHHVDTVIRPALAQGQLVLCDRYTDSTLAYQGYGRGLNLQELKLLNQLATGGLQPDLVIWLDLPVEQGQTRIQARAERDRLEAEALAFHQRVHSGYAALAAENPEHWLHIDAQAAVERVSQVLWQAIQRYLPEL